MSISITTAEVKRKAMIPSGDTTYDSSIASLITEMQPAIEHTIDDRYLDDSDAGLQAALKLGILEMITGEFLEQLRREQGASEQFSIAGVSIGQASPCGAELIAQGAERLSPYLTCALPMMADTASSSSTSDVETTFSDDEEVW